MYVSPKVALVVEPDTPARLEVRRTLTPHDWRVYDARDGLEALAIVSTLGGRLNLLMLELALPDTDGIGLACRIAARRPEVKVLITSSSCQDVLFLHPEMTGRVQFLPKPFKPGALLRVVREILAAPAEAAVQVRARSVGLLNRPPAEPRESVLRLAHRIARLRRRFRTAYLANLRAIHQYEVIRRRSLALWQEICELAP